MGIDTKKIFDSFYKRHKVVSAAAFFFSIALLCEVIWYEFNKTLTAVSIIQDKVLVNESDIANIKKHISTQDGISRDIVKRISFNQYIQRKDDEYHEQMILNNLIAAKIGFLEGQVDILSADKVN